MEEVVVEDTPPSKIVRKGVMHWIEKKIDGSKKKELNLEDAVVEANPPSKVVCKGGNGKITRSARVARGVKPKHPILRKPQDVNEGEICHTAYRASLNGMRILMEELELSARHKRIMRKTWFWLIFNAIVKKQLTHELFQKSNHIIIRIINAYNPETDGFKLGEKISLG